jgi:hypothetical protein
VVAALESLGVPNGRRDLSASLRARAEIGASIVFLRTRATTEADAPLLQGLSHWVHRSKAEPFIADDAAIVRRIARAHHFGAQSQLIASAAIEGATLVVWSCEPRRYVVPLETISPLARLTPAGVAQFDINDSGSRIHWPEGDVDLDLDALRTYSDPKLRKRKERERREWLARFGDGVRALREEHELRQIDITGLTERQVRRIEAGESVPHGETLGKLATAHGMTSNEYLRALAKRRAAKGGGRARGEFLDGTTKPPRRKTHAAP